MSATQRTVVAQAVATAVAALLVATAVAATAAELPAQSLDEIVARHVAARGGREALAAVRSVRMSGHVVAGPGRQAIIRREIARAGRIRTEFVFQGTTAVYAWNGSAGFRLSPFEGIFEPEALPAEEAVLAAEQADLDGPLVGWKAKGHRVELAGRETLATGSAYRLTLTLASGATRQLWLDAASGLLVRQQSTRRLRGHDVVVETSYEDYRPTGGIPFARAIQAGVQGRPERLRIVVEQVELNPALDDGRFVVPR